MSESANCAKLKSLLEKYSLGRYYQGLVDEGISSIAKFVHATEADLVYAGVFDRAALRRMSILKKSLKANHDRLKAMKAKMPVLSAGPAQPAEEAAPEVEAEEMEGCPVEEPVSANEESAAAQSAVEVPEGTPEEVAAMDEEHEAKESTEDENQEEPSEEVASGSETVVESDEEASEVSEEEPNDVVEWAKEEEAKDRKKKRKKGWTVFLVIAAVLAAGAFVYFKFFR